MSLSDPNISRHSGRHPSGTIANPPSPAKYGAGSHPASQDVFGGEAQSRKPAQNTHPDQMSVAPIRSLSIRQQPRNSSSTSLRSFENHQQQLDRVPRRAASQTIRTTIQKLEDLLGQLGQMAIESENMVSFGEDPPSFRRTSTRPSPAIRLRTASLPLVPPVIAKERPKTALAWTDRRVTFSEDDTIRSKAPRNNCLSESIRACDPVHLRRKPYKAAPAPSVITGQNSNFEMKLIRRRSLSDSGFQENFAPNPERPVSSLPLEESSHKQKPRRSGEARISASRKNYKRRVKANQPPPVLPRTSSIRESSHEDDDPLSIGSQIGFKEHEAEPLPGHERHYTQLFGINSKQTSIDLAHIPPIAMTAKFDLRKQRHVDVLGNPDNFDLHEACHHAPVARDWPTSRKRYAAVISCLNASCIGLIIGIYSGEVPAIQYVIVDFHHYTILGNVFLYCAMAFPTLFLWPLRYCTVEKYTQSEAWLLLCACRSLRLLL